MTDGSVPVVGGEKTSSSLLVRVKARDPDAWRRLVHLYGPLVYRWCRQAGLRESDAADVGQEVFLAVSRAVAAFRRDREGDSFRAWLKTITRNKIRDFARRMPAGGEGEGGSEAQARLLAAAEAETEDDSADRLLVLSQAVEAHLADHKEQTRRAFVRIVIGKQDPAEVAQELGLTLNAVYLSKSRILRQLREEYAELLELD